MLYQFDDLVIDTGNYRVVKGNEDRPLTPRAFAVLEILMRHQGRLVERQFLFEEVWKDAFVTDNTLSRMIKEIRDALGDGVDQPRYIETVPKRGYRFIAQITMSAITEAPKTIAKSLAVLPFINAGADRDVEYLSDGITASIINNLSQLPMLRVMARGTVFSYKERGEIAPQMVGKELNVNVVLTGKIVQLKDTWVISAELADAQEGTQLWGGQYNQEPADLFDIQEEIAREISEKLQLKLTDEEQKQLTKRPTENAEAYHLYLRGYYALYKFTPESLAKSFEYFNQAIDKDPEYALAYAGLVEAYFNLSFLVHPAEVWVKAKAAALKALQIDGALAEAHYAMALVSICYDRDWRTAESEFQRAIELKPNYALAHDWYGWSVLAQSGRFDKAITEIKKGLELDPLSLATETDLGTCYYWAGQYELAVEHLTRVVTLEDNFYVAHIFLGLTYAKVGQFAEAIIELKKAGAQSNNPVAMGILGYIYGIAGLIDEAQKILDELQQQSHHQYIPADAIGVVYTGLGKKDAAFEWLRKACDERTIVSLAIRVEPMHDSLRQDPRFADLLLRVGLEP